MNRYSSVVRWSDEDDAYIAVCPELGGVSAFGDTPAEALQELEVAAGLALETYQEKGWPIPPPAVVEDQEYSGQFRARLPKSLHAQLARRADADGVSLNTAVVAAVSSYLGRAASAEEISAELKKVQRSLVSLSGAVSTLSRAATADDPSSTRGRRLRRAK